jgi:ribosomal protein S27AE
LFDKNRIAHGWRKGLLIWPALIWLVIIGLGVVLILYGMSIRATPVTTSDLIVLIYIGLLGWYSNRQIARFGRLVDDRIILASDHMVGFREFGVCLELFKPDAAGPDSPKSARMIKYAAKCPTCGAQVLLAEGEPDFPRRMVGRCQESPREHLYSFVRATRTGYRLR